MSLIFHEQADAAQRRIESLLTDYVKLTRRDAYPVACPRTDPHDGPHGWLDNGARPQCCDGVPAACDWCGATPAVHPLDGENLCAVCYPGGAA